MHHTRWFHEESTDQFWPVFLLPPVTSVLTQSWPNILEIGLELFWKQGERQEVLIGLYTSSQSDEGIDDNHPENYVKRSNPSFTKDEFSIPK